MLSGCRHGDGPETPVSGNASCDLVVTIDIDGLSPRDQATRAVWDDDYPEEAPISFEDNIKDVSLWFVTSSDLSMPLTSESVESEDGRRRFKAKVNLADSYVTHTGDGFFISGRIVAIANHPAIDFSLSPFSQPEFNVLHINDTQTIPMWGVSTVSNLKLIPNGSVDAGNIKLLRSVPKISISLSDDFKDDYKIVDVRPETSDYAQFAYVTPSGCRDAGRTGALSIENCFNPRTGNYGQGLAFNGLGTADVYAYAAERGFSGSPAVPARLIVTLQRTDGTRKPFSGYLMLCDYKDGVPMEGSGFTRLVRNHDYRYVLSLSELLFKISFSEWVFGGKVHIELE